jgi:pimeloyl-ACP methyl ester carboxylesterase
MGRELDSSGVGQLRWECGYCYFFAWRCCVSSKLRAECGRFRLSLALSLTTAGLIGVGMASALAQTPSTSHVVTRAYLMSGFGDAGTGAMNTMGAKLRAHGIIVTVGSYTQADAFAADACAHSKDRIIVVGYSLGATAGAQLATAARACGVHYVRLVGIDPLGSSAAVSSGVSATNFVGALQGTISGARNTAAPGYDHAGIINSPRMQARFVAAALSH